MQDDIKKSFEQIRQVAEGLQGISTKLEKAAPGNGLVAKKVLVNKDGKSFYQTVYVRTGEEKPAHKPYARKKYKSIPIQPGDKYLHSYRDGQQMTEVNSIEDGKVLLGEKHSWHSEGYGNTSRQIRVDKKIVQKKVDEQRKEKHEEQEDVNEAAHNLSQIAGIDKIKPKSLYAPGAIDELVDAFAKLKKAISPMETKQEFIGGTYYGGTQMFAAVSGNVDISFNHVHRGGYYEGTHSGPVAITIGSGIANKDFKAIKQVAKDLLGKFSQGKSPSPDHYQGLRESSGTNYSTVLLQTGNQWMSDNKAEAARLRLKTKMSETEKSPAKAAKKEPKSKSIAEKQKLLDATVLGGVYKLTYNDGTQSTVTRTKTSAIGQPIFDDAEKHTTANMISDIETVRLPRAAAATPAVTPEKVAPKQNKAASGATEKKVVGHESFDHPAGGKLNKGDKVTFDHKGEMKTGTVVKTNVYQRFANPYVFMKGDDGKTYELVISKVNKKGANSAEEVNDHVVVANRGRGQGTYAAHPHFVTKEEGEKIAEQKRINHGGATAGGSTSFSVKHKDDAKEYLGKESFESVTHKN